MNLQLAEHAARRLVALRDRAIVAVDGVDGAGKTTFADVLANHLEKLGRPVTRASVDGFHNPANVRYARGRNSPQGFYLDSYDYDGLRESLLDPFRNGHLKVLASLFDHEIDDAKRVWKSAPPTALLVLDGIFLHREELLHQWDFSIFLSVPFAVSYARMAQRDGCDPDPHADGNSRYYQGQLLYHRECDPETRANLVITDW
ncbi:uridine kinase [Pseudoruegeria sp. HB172150]|uniref:uridine kinase n=1 Tax=Pseudoruegeria sp. HB172150 TaxID=2721164 RepID=UPI001553C537|nr:uridine kinase [Pseudoruegeria sp. HB172150]